MTQLLLAFAWVFENWFYVKVLKIFHCQIAFLFIWYYITQLDKCHQLINEMKNLIKRF